MYCTRMPAQFDSSAEEFLKTCTYTYVGTVDSSAEEFLINIFSIAGTVDSSAEEFLTDIYSYFDSYFRHC